jgi:uncharacterized membrane protein
MSDYENLPIGTKYLQLVAGLLPPFATWWLTGSVWYAIAVYLIGFVIGHVVIYIHGQYVAWSIRRDASRTIEDWREQTLPVFLWGPPICGALAAAAFILLV